MTSTREIRTDLVSSFNERLTRKGLNSEEFLGKMVENG